MKWTDPRVSPQPAADWRGDSLSFTDNAAAFNAAMAILATSPDKTLELDAAGVGTGGAVYGFLTQPGPIPAGVSIVGHDPFWSMLCKCFPGRPGGVGAPVNEFLVLTHAGSALRNLAVQTDARFGDAVTGPGWGVSLRNPDPTLGLDPNEPDNFQMENVYITSPNGGLWVVPFALDGRARYSPLAQGIREVTVKDCQFFNAQVASVSAQNVVGLKFVGGGVYQGNGNPAGTGVWVGGIPGGRNSVDTQFLGFSNNGQLNLTGGAIDGCVSGGLVAQFQCDATINPSAPSGSANLKWLTW